MKVFAPFTSVIHLLNQTYLLTAPPNSSQVLYCWTILQVHKIQDKVPTAEFISCSGWNGCFIGL